MGRFEGKVALVTGATSGIGAEVARTLAAEGAVLLLSGRDRQRGELVRVELSGTGHQFLEANLDSADGCSALADTALETAKNIDILVNSAGVVHHKTVPDTTDAQWAETLALNVSAVFYLCRSLIPKMVSAGRGTVVNVASTWGLVGAAQTAAYCASKGAVIQLTRAMAVDHAAQGVRINAVCPGAVDTPMLLGEAAAFGMQAQDARRTWAADAANGRLASAADVASSVAFLASEDAAHVHGAVLAVDGGATAF